MSLRLLLLALGLATSALAVSTDRRVPQTYPTIQSAINVSSPGDRVLVSKGVFKGAGNVELDFKGKVITLQGAGYLRTIIDGEGTHRAFLFHSNETPSTTVRSLTVRNGASTSGGALAILGASPTFVRCCFEDKAAGC